MEKFTNTNINSSRSLNVPVGNYETPWVIRIIPGHLCSAKALIQDVAVIGQMSHIDQEMSKSHEE